jgi:multimeric flavodoxin WrbA
MYVIITASPNSGGLTAACGSAAQEGITDAGGTAEVFDISAAHLEPCRICGDGWGACREKGKCIIGDTLTELREAISGAKGVLLITPVYWWQPSERMKYFLDRFRRCEAFNQSGGAAFGKHVHLIAAAGGSGNGTAQCLDEMERWCRHVGAIPQERIGVTRFNRAYMLPAIKDAAARLVKGEYFNRA